MGVKSKRASVWPGFGFPFPATAKPYLHDLAYNGFGKARRRLDKESGVTDYTFHDLRRTFRTKWAELGINNVIAEKYINHIAGEHSGVSAIYDRHNYLPEMRAAVVKWEVCLKNLLVC